MSDQNMCTWTYELTMKEVHESGTMAMTISKVLSTNIKMDLEKFSNSAVCSQNPRDEFESLNS